MIFYAIALTKFQRKEKIVLMAIWVPDLAGRKGPKYLQIVEVMAEEIADGRLPVGARLPPHRELAYQLQLSPNTTNRAYAEAVRRSLLRGEVGRGTFVRSLVDLDDAEPETLRRSESGPIDLSRNLPLAGLAERYIADVMRDIARDAQMATLLDYQTDGDLERHREAGRIWLSGCGLEADLDCVVPVAGGQHGIICALMALLRPGDLLLTEALTYTPVLAMADRLNLQTAAVALDAEGVKPDSFEAWCQTANPKAFYLTPTLQEPTGATLSAARREAIGAIARRHDVIVIEDDVFGAIKPDKPSPIACFAPDHTLYITSLSKAVAPGLRVGFLKAPAKLAGALHQSVNLSVWMTSPINLEIAKRLIGDGTAGLLTQKQCELAGRRQRLTAEALGAEHSPAEGYHVWLNLPDGWRSDVFAADCAQMGVLVSEGRQFAQDAKGAPEAIRFCVSHEVSEARLKKGVEIIADILARRPSGSRLSI
ncbi:MAG: PLP-dependent aminotransferase family protein [Pseudomonadota bacterium]